MKREQLICFQSDVVGSELAGCKDRRVAVSERLVPAQALALARNVGVEKERAFAVGRVFAYV